MSETPGTDGSKQNCMYAPPSLSQPAIMWYEGESCIGLPPMVALPAPNMRFVVDWLEDPEKPVKCENVKESWVRKNVSQDKYPHNNTNQPDHQLANGTGTRSYRCYLPHQ